MTFVEETEFDVPVQTAVAFKDSYDFPGSYIALVQSQDEFLLRGIPDSALHD
jgi:hypothetical protein